MSPSKVRLINFNDTDAVDQLLRPIGIESGLGNFLIDHLTDVLRKQYSNAVIESIELQGVDKCSMGGMQISNSSVINVDSCSIPLDVGIVVSVGDKRVKLALHVDIRAKSDGDKIGAESDVFVRDQTEL